MDYQTTFHGLVYHDLSAFVEHHADTFERMVLMMKKKRGPDCTDREAEKLVLFLLGYNSAEDVWDALVKRDLEAATREAEKASSFRDSAIRNAGANALHLALEQSLVDEKARKATLTCSGPLVCVCEHEHECVRV